MNIFKKIFFKKKNSSGIGECLAKIQSTQIAMQRAIFELNQRVKELQVEFRSIPDFECFAKLREEIGQVDFKVAQLCEIFDDTCTTASDLKRSVDNATRNPQLPAPNFTPLPKVRRVYLEENEGDLLVKVLCKIKNHSKADFEAQFFARLVAKSLEQYSEIFDNKTDKNERA